MRLLTVPRRVALATTLAVLSISPVLPLTATAGGVVIRTSTLTTANCAGAGGLCQANNPNQPGGNNPDVITATMTLTDNGTTMVGSGTGSGFDPAGYYVSLIYLNPNVATCARFPQGQSTQFANTANADNDFVSMFLGYWVVRADGTALFTVYAGKPSPLGGNGASGLAAYATVSVREVAGASNGNGQLNNATTNIAAGRDIPPNVFPLRACGSLA